MDDRPAGDRRWMGAAHHDGVVQRDLRQREHRIAPGSAGSRAGCVQVRRPARSGPRHSCRAGRRGATARTWRMKIHASNAIENGFDGPVDEDSVADAAPVCLTWPRAPKSTLSSMGMIITQIQQAHGQVDLSHFRAADGLEHARRELAERDTGDDAQQHPRSGSARRRSWWGRPRGRRWVPTLIAPPHFVPMLRSSCAATWHPGAESAATGTDASAQRQRRIRERLALLRRCLQRLQGSGTQCADIGRPHGADLAGGVVQNREDEISSGAPGAASVPVLAVAGGRHVQPLQRGERQWVDFALGVAARRVSAAPLAQSLRMPSARMERAELPVQMNRAL